MTTTIKNISEYKNYEKYIKGNVSEDDMDATPYKYNEKTDVFDIKNIRIKYDFHPRSKIIILVELFFQNKKNPRLNKDNKFTDNILLQCPEDFEGAERSQTYPWMFGVRYPVGDVIIFGETKKELEERKKQEEENKRCKKVRKELMDKLKNLNEVKLCMVVDKIEDMLESIGE